MGIKKLIKKVLGIPEIGLPLRVELPSEEEKRKTIQIRLQNEKIRDQAIQIRKLEKELLKIKKKEVKIDEEKKIIKEVLAKSKVKEKQEIKTKAIYKLVYPNQKPFIEYANGKRRILDGFEINETRDGTPLFRLRFYSPEHKTTFPLQLDAQELTFFFKNIIGLASQHNSGLIQLNVDEIDNKPVFIESEIDFLKSRELKIRYLTKKLADKDEQSRKVMGQMNTLQEIQSEQEKDLADADMALRYAKKDSENKSAKLESVMNINAQISDKMRDDHISKSLTDVKLAQSLRTLTAFEQNNEILNQKLTEAYSSETYELGKQDTLEMLEKITKNILSVQSATKQIASQPTIIKQIKTAKPPEK